MERIGPILDRVVDFPCTTGEWESEADSVAAFDDAVLTTGLFNIYSEIWGWYVQPRVGQELKRPRIDRILTPTARALAAGWIHGPVGVECKASKAKMGPPIAQMLDYSRAVWQGPHGYNVWLSWIFLWPCEKPHGFLASLLAQNRLGTACSTAWDSLRLFSGEEKILRARRSGEVEIGAALNGRRTGSR